MLSLNDYVVTIDGKIRPGDATTASDTARCEQESLKWKTETVPHGAELMVCIKLTIKPISM
jgi:N-acetylneuraminic acid mutarotase